MAGYEELVEYFQVQYQIYGTTDDGIDADDLPDRVDINGWITFTPNLKKGRGILFQTATVPFELMPGRRRVRVENGRLSHNDTGYVKLEAATPNGNPSDWNWKVTFDLASPTGKLDLASFDIAAVPGSIVNLTTAAPVGASTGTTIVRGATGTSVGEIRLVNGDTFEFYGDDPDHTFLGSAIVPALTINDETREAADDAIAAKNAAEDARDTAVSAKNASESARDTAMSAKNAAESARDAAAGSASAASGSASSASSSAIAASGSASLANSAKTAAETARDQAVSAKNAAETAQTGANSAKGAAETARDEAVSAKNAAETARSGAEAAQAAAEQARDDAAAGVVPDNAVTTAKIVNGAVTTDKLAGTAVTEAKIANGAVTTDKLAGTAVTEAKIDNGAVTNGKIAPGTIAKDRLVSGVQASLDKADTAYQKPGGGIPASDLAPGHVKGADSSGAKTYTIWTGTQAQYDAISAKDPNTLYCVKGE